jgi:hypothetical protein
MHRGVRRLIEAIPETDPHAWNWNLSSLASAGVIDGRRFSDDSVRLGDLRRSDRPAAA